MLPDQQLAVDRFADAIGSSPINLGDAGLCLALSEEPELDLAAWRDQLDRLGAALKDRLPGDAEPRRQLDGLRGFLFGELGLLGNEDDYYNPKNSYLHHVLKRGLGIPISLSVITMEVGRRAGIPLFGVGFPTHFLVGAPGGVFIDPFHQGRILTEDDCVRLLAELTGGAIFFRPEYLAACTPRAILFRMLSNLKSIHLRRGELDLALVDVERLLLLNPNLVERRDRGLIQLARGSYAEAVGDLEAYLAKAEDPPDAELIQTRVDEARRGLRGG